MRRFGALVIAIVLGATAAFAAGEGPGEFRPPHAPQPFSVMRTSGSTGGATVYALADGVPTVATASMLGIAAIANATTKNAGLIVLDPTHALVIHEFGCMSSGGAVVNGDQNLDAMDVVLQTSGNLFSTPEGETWADLTATPGAIGRVRFVNVAATTDELTDEGTGYLYRHVSPEAGHPGAVAFAPGEVVALRIGAEMVVDTAPLVVTGVQGIDLTCWVRGWN